MKLRKPRKYTYGYNYRRILRDKMYFGGNKIKALERDGWKCVKCGMTNEEHHKRWNCYLTVDHIDGRGMNTEDKNNALDNLQTLCCHCHGKKDIWKSNAHPRPIYQMTLDGKIIHKYESIAEADRHQYDERGVIFCCKGIQKTFRGYKWAYADTE